MDQELVDIILKVVISAIGILITALQGSKWLAAKKASAKGRLWELGEMAVTIVYQKFVRPIKDKKEQDALAAPKKTDAIIATPGLTLDEKNTAMSMAVEEFTRLAARNGADLKTIGDRPEIAAYLERVLATVKSK